MKMVERGFTRPEFNALSNSLTLDFETFIPIANALLEIGRKLFTLQPHIVSMRKKDGSPVTEADKIAQAAITSRLHIVAPGIPVRGEEDDHSAPLVSHSAKMYWSVDPIDGTKFYGAMMSPWCISVALIVDEEPRAAIVLQPAVEEAFIGIQGKGIRIYTKDEPRWKELERKKPVYPMLGVPVSESVLCNKEHPEYATQASRLTYAFKNTFSAPSVLSVLEIIRGHAWGWASIFEPYHWDIAGTYVLMREIGGVATCVNGDPIPWDWERIPPVVFATSWRKAAQIRAVLNPRIKKRVRKT